MNCVVSKHRGYARRRREWFTYPAQLLETGRHRLQDCNTDAEDMVQFILFFYDAWYFLNAVGQVVLGREG
jgi:hypothetical protein